MTYRELYESATRKLEKSEITLGEYEEMTKPLNEDVRTWIPCSERLPKDEQEVQITYKINNKHHVWSAIWDKLHGRFYDKEYRSYISLNYVTAWMPLPKPYKAESEDKE